MVKRSAFHLDCFGIIPECQFKCADCVAEIRSVLGQVQGVKESGLEGDGENAKFVVEYDPSTVTVEQLMNTFRSLPSFYEGFFVPTLLGG